MQIPFKFNKNEMCYYLGKRLNKEFSDGRRNDKFWYEYLTYSSDK